MSVEYSLYIYLEVTLLISYPTMELNKYIFIVNLFSP